MEAALESVALQWGDLDRDDHVISILTVRGDLQLLTTNYELLGMEYLRIDLQATWVLVSSCNREERCCILGDQ